ncbi:VOC family protein [Granulicoccus phenolivorans]|uniref:VOC family protein n=1 Tax=Granulicoccus phenolivorans TaxID=266854 RepID=UPI00040048F3|nr:VOC family protein [Granulicoccus phenolivorans]
MSHAATDPTYPPERYPYGRPERYHLHHVHMFASDVDATIAFYQRWFDAHVAWDGGYAGARNVFLKIGLGAMHLYDQAPRDLGRNAVHHLGIQVVGLEDLYARMEQAGLDLRNPIRVTGGSKYFMLAAPDNVLLELFEPGAGREPEARAYYGFDA